MTTTLTDDKTVLGVYAEICRSYHAVDDFRMKLLGFLPVTSLVGIFGLSTNTALATPSQADLAGRLAGFVGTFAAIFTAALFVYEIRGILRCNDLIKRGQRLENELGVPGQFCVCVATHEDKKSPLILERIGSALDAKLAACVIYCSVISAWIFTALHFGMGWTFEHCALISSGFGVGTGIAAYFLVRRLIAA